MSSLSINDELATWRKADLIAAAEKQVDRWLTVEDVCAITQLADRTIQKYVASGKLRHYRVGGSGSLRFRQADVDALMVLDPRCEGKQ